MIVPGGTESVAGLGAGICIKSGWPPTITVFEAHAAGGATTEVHGFVPAGVGTTGHPATTEPGMSASLSAGCPPMVTWNCFGITVTFPPCGGGKH